MKSGALKRALGLALLYFGIFVAIVLVQFSGSRGLSEKFGKLSVSASYPKSARAQAGVAPELVRLSYAGFSLELSSKSPAERVGADGAVSRLALEGIEKLKNGVRVKLESGISLTATADRGSPERFSLAVSAPAAVASLRLRVLSSTARVSGSGALRTLSSGGSSYGLSLGSGSWDIDSGLLTLVPGDTGLALASLAPPPTQKPAQAASPEKPVAPAPKDPTVVSAELTAWRDKSWAGLSSARFDADKVTWKGSDGVPVFSEKALVAYLSESLARGSYSDALARAKGAKDKWPDKLSYLSAPYLGGLVPKMRALEAADAAEARRLSELVGEKSPTIFEKEGLLRFLVDKAPYSLAKDALRYFSEADPAKITVRQAVGLLACAMDAKDLVKAEDNPLPDPAVAADRVAGAIRKTATGFFLASEDDGFADIRLSLIAGKSLAAYGTAASKPALVGFGQALLEGALGLADAQGFVPARVAAKAGAVDQRIGTIAPEELYFLVADELPYPREESFAKELGPGVWAWTCAPTLDVQASASRYVFTARFPEGRSHYLAFYGIKSFANIQLYDIDYSPDSEFENYDASGYLYSKDSKALYLKMKHKKESEDIKLTF
jgi:hypothetical protein